MPIQRESSTSNDKTVMKGGGQDVAVGNPGVMNNIDVATNPNLATPRRGNDIIDVTQGSDEQFDARSSLVGDDFDILSYHIKTPTATTHTVFFIADQEMTLKSADVRIGAKGGSGFTGQIMKADSGTAIESGTAMTAAIAIGSGATDDTNVSGTLDSTDANLRVSAGQAVGIKFAGTHSSAADLTVTLKFKRVLNPVRKKG